MSRTLSPPNVPDPDGSLPIAFGELLAGKYRVDQLLGRGGMAVVLAGTHVALDAPIAIKVLLPGRAGNPDAVRRFLTEARAAAKLKCPNVARISDVGTSQTSGGGTLPFIVMERLDGVDLETLMEQRQKLPVDEAVDFVRQACRGLEEAHSQGIIHRDIKPANLFLTHTREGAPLVKVLDFGISKTIASIGAQHQRAITGDREVMGSPGYMSPEQVRAAKDIDVRTDIWSLGVVLHELITGANCFDGDELPDIFAAIMHGDPPPIDETVPAEVRAIVWRCLQKDPSRRYRSAAELTQALGEAVDRPNGVPVSVSRSLSNRGPLLAAIVAAVVVIGGVAIFAHAQRDQEIGPPAVLSLENATTMPPPVAAPPPPATTIIVSAPPPVIDPASSSSGAPRPSGVAGSEVESPPPRLSHPPGAAPKAVTPAPTAPTAPPPAATTPASPKTGQPPARRRTDW